MSPAVAAWVSDSRARARNVNATLRAAGEGRYDLTSGVLEALAVTAGRVAVDLARAERDLCLAGVA